MTRNTRSAELLLKGSTSSARFTAFFLLPFVMCNGCRPLPVPVSIRSTLPQQRPTLSSVSSSQDSTIRFEEVASKRGLAYRWPQQPRPLRNLEAFGCGCAFLDYDDDGWMDILLVGSPCPHLYHNRHDGTFEDVTNAVGLDKIQGQWHGVAVGDYDGNGRLDIVLTGYHCLALLKNVDGKNLVDVTRQAGLDPKNRSHWGSSAAFMDLDGSGRLALILLNYVIFGPKEPQYCDLVPGVQTGCPPAVYRPEYPELWQNRGGGKFEDITAVSGFKNTHGKALVIAFADIDDDGRIDFYIGNDGVPAELMHNLGGLRFQNISRESGVAYAQLEHSIAAMGADWADYDRDGRPDLAVSAFSGEPYSLMHNLGHNLFEHVEDRTGIAGATLNPLGFGTKWIDVDNDGWPDLMFANGHVYDKVEQVDPTSTFKESLILFHNEPEKNDAKARQFIDLIPTMKGDIAKPILGRGLATGDFDNDGRVDVVVVDFEGTPLLLHNVSQTSNHWITLDIRSTGHNHFAYGAKITARASHQIWTANVTPASSYLSSSDPRIHFGLGNVSLLDTVTIRWPDGVTQVVKNVSADHILQITEGRKVPKLLH